jgi:hypothetical protein
VDLRARLDFLVWVDAHAGRDDALGADRDLVPDRDTLLQARMRTQVAGTPEHRALDEDAATDVRAGVDDRPLDACPFAQRHIRPENGVGADDGARRDPAVVADERGALDLVEVGDVRAVADPDVAAELDPRDRQAHRAVERVVIRLPVLVEVSDVLPVAVHHVPVQRPAHLQQEREELLGEVVRTVARHVPQHLRREDVDAGIDRVREDLSPRRLLEEALDAAVLVRDDDPELERVLDRLQADRHRRALLLMLSNELRQVDVAERVARDDQERFVAELARRERDRAGRAERRFLDRVADVHAQRIAAPEVAPHRLGQERDGDHHVLQLVLLEELEDVLHARLPCDRDHRLGLVRGQRAQARALPAGHDHRLHVRTSRRAFSRYWPSAATARAKPAQKMTSGHVSPSCVTITSASDAYSSQVASLPRKLTSNL